MKKLLLSCTLFLLLLMGCSNGAEHTGPGKVVSVDWHHRSFTFRTQNNHYRDFAPLCWNEMTPPSMPVWEGMQAEDIEFHYNYDIFSGCYRINEAVIK